MSDCLPCDLEAADAAAVVFRDGTLSCEVADGYDVPDWFILRLRRHAEGWSGPTPAELATFGPLSQRLAAAVQAATGAPILYFMNFGENYPHSTSSSPPATPISHLSTAVRASSISAPRTAISTPPSKSPQAYARS